LQKLGLPKAEFTQSFSEPKHGFLPLANPAFWFQIVMEKFLHFFNCYSLKTAVVDLVAAVVLSFTERQICD